MFEQLRKQSRGRIIIALIFSLFILRLPGFLPLVWKWLTVVAILIFFLGIPDLKGFKGGLIAGIFSLVFAGLGQFYVRQYTRGFVFVLTGVFAYMTSGYSVKSIIFNDILFVFSAIDAFSYGKRGIGIL